MQKWEAVCSLVRPVAKTALLRQPAACRHHCSEAVALGQSHRDGMRFCLQLAARGLSCAERPPCLTLASTPAVAVTDRGQLCFT